MRTRRVPGKIAAVVLAAGASVRLGRPKQLLRYRGRSLLRNTVECAARAGCRPVVVVVGAAAGAVRAEISGHPVEIVESAHWREGLSASIRTGVGWLTDHAPDVRGVALLVCDQPRLTTDVVGALCAAFDGTEGRIVACEYGGVLGVPALFERTLFSELVTLRGAGGAKSVLRERIGDVARVAWPEGAVDVDVAEDVAHAPGVDQGRRQ